MKSIFITTVLLSLIISSQAYIINVDELPNALQNRVIPDLMGRVNMINDPGDHNVSKDIETRDLPSVVDGFPVSYSSSNCYKGAIYLNMDEDDDLEIVFGVGTKIAALNLDGSAVPGWPVNNTYYIWSSPACGDIDGDGEDEIVATSRNNTTGNIGELYAYELDGSSCSGFPVTMAGGGTMNACLADLDNDADLEILVNVRNSPEGWVYAYQGDGTVIAGWPASLDYVPGASISVGDLDNDGNVEVIALSYYSLYVFNASGELLDGFPFTEAGTTVSYSQPVLYDMDSDGDLEILYGACNDGGGKVFAFHHDGTMVEGWPQTTSYWIYATVALGDVDGDGALDVVVGDQVGSGTAADYLYAWDLNGNDLAGFPAGPIFAVNTQVAIADIDGDENVEIMIDDNRFGIGYECYNHDGTHDDEWPLSCGTAWSSTTMMITPVIGDFNNDGYLDITGAATDIMTWVVEAYVWTTGTSWNEDLAYSVVDGHNVQHTGLYPVAADFFPEPPRDVIAQIIDYNSINLYWNPPENETPSAYYVYLDGELLGNSPGCSFLYEYFDAGEYTLAVSAYYDDQQSELVYADPVEVILYEPEDLTYEIAYQPTEVILNWAFVELRGLEAFIIYRDGEEYDQSTQPGYVDINVNPDHIYEYYVTALYHGGYESAASNTVEVTVTNSDNNNIPPMKIRLLGNYPNPFNPETVISIQFTDVRGQGSGVSTQEEVELAIYSTKGQKIKKYSISNLQYSFSNNVYSLTWDGTDQMDQPVPSGIYLYQLKAGNYIATRKMLLLK